MATAARAYSGLVVEACNEGGFIVRSVLPHPQGMPQVELSEPVFACSFLTEATDFVQQRLIEALSPKSAPGDISPEAWAKATQQSDEQRAEMAARL